MAELTDVVLGGCKKFECRVLGFPRPEIRWYKDGIEITHVKRYNFDFTQDGTISMVMENISHKDQGMYRCRADNSEGTASTSAYLFVRQRRGLLDEDTMSIHSMTMSEVDVDYAERQMDFEGYAKRIQSDFNGEEFLDEFGRKQKFEEILIEDSKSFRKTEGEEGQEKGMKEKPEKVGKNGHLQETSKEESSFYSEECYEGASVKISKTEESESYSASTSLKSESYEETKMSSTVSVEEFQSESKSKESSVLKVETSISESKTSTNASESQSESHMSIESEISSTEYSTEKSKSKLDVESSLENNDKMVTDSRKESKITAESEIYNTKDSTTEEAGLIVKTETNVNNISEEVHGSDLSIESDISSNKYSVEEETVTSVESVSKTSKKQIEEDSISLFSSEVNVEETENDSQLFFQSSDTSIENSTSSSSKTTVEEKAKLTSIEVDIEESSVQQTSLIADTSIEVDSTEGDGSILVDSSSEIETTKYKRKKRMSVEMEIEETSTVEIDMETRVLKSKMLEEIKTLTAEMQTMSKDNVPTDMGSVSSIFSLFSEEGAEESTTPANPSDVLEAKIRSKIQARVLETESNADAESVENIDLTEGEVDEFRIGDEIRAAVRAEHETLAGTQDLALPADSLLDLPMDDKEVLSTSLGHDSGIFEMSTLETSVIAGEASVDLVTDDATIDSVSTLESSVTESNTTEVFEEKRSRTGEAASLEVFGRVMEQTAEADSLSTENLDDVSPEEIQIKKSGESLDQTESKRETALADELDVGISDLTEEVSPCDEDVASPLSQANEKLADKDKLSEAERKQDSFKVSEQILEDNDSSELSDVVSFKSQRAEETADLDQKQLDTTNSQIQTALADEQNVVSDEASSVSNLESLSAEELSICSQIDQKDALSRAKTDQETALADALSSTAEDVSLISELSDLESGKANELLVDDEVEGKPSLEQSKSSKQSLFTDELVGKDDSSIVSDLTDLESIKVDECTEDLQSGELNKNVEISQDLLKTDELGIGGDEGSVVSDIKTADSVLADEMSVDGQSELGEVKVQSEETWHAEQMSDTESLRDEIREMQSGDASVEADVSQEAVGEIGNAEKTRDNILISETELGQSNEFVEDLLDSNAGNSVIDREPKDLDKLQSKDVVKSFDASSRDVTPTPENVGTLTPESLEAEDQLSIQSAINEETVSTISEGSVREADDFGMDEMLPSGGQFITSPSDLTSLVRDGQKTSRVSAQLSEELAHDMIDGALKDLELDSSVVTKEPSPDHVDVKSEEDILEAPEERKKYKVEDQELSFLPSDEPVEKKKTKTKKSKKDDELTFSTSVETSETTADTMENGSLIQAEVDISEVKYDDDGMLISASIDVEEVRHPPQVVRVSEDVNVNLGETIHLESEVTGSPQPDVKWFKEGEKVGENQRITLVTNDNVYSLDICEAEGSDGGKYTLTAHNSEGTIFSDVHVDVTIPQGQDDKITMEGQNISVTATLSLPEFTRPPEDATVSEFDPVTFVCEVTGNPEPNVNWRKEGKKLKADSKMRIYESDGQHFLEIPQSSFLDAGEYECEATNSEGTTSCHVVLTVEAATEQESGLSAAEEVAQPSESDDLFLQEFVAVNSYVDEGTKVTLNVGDVVEVLDSKLTTGSWLVRKQTDKEQVCYVPVSTLKRMDEYVKDLSETSSRKKDLRLSRSPSLRLDQELETSEDEAGLFHRKESFEVYMVVAAYNQTDTEPDSLRLVEGQFVEVIDKQRHDLWLVRTKPTKTTPSKQGWVPSAYFDVKTSMAPVIKQDPRESFRDNILHIDNKRQEAMLKRRYLLTELIETEREYVKDLEHVVEVYHGRFTEHDAPDVLRNKHTDIFSNIKAVLKFHHDYFLNALNVSSAFPGKIGGVFLKNRDYFMMYVEYLYSREAAGFFLDTDEAKQFYKKYSRSIGESENNFPLLLSKGEQRLATYMGALKEFLKYSQQAGDEEAVKEMEKAVAMLNEVYKRVEQRKLLEALEGFTGDLEECGLLTRHDDVLMWDAEPSITRSKERHALLFPDKLVLTKRKRPDSPTETTTFIFKSAVQLVDVQINETVEEDERRFELWTAEPTTEVLTFKTRSVFAKQAWVKDIREALVKLGVTETDVMADRKNRKPVTPPSPSTPRNKKSSESGSLVIKPEDIELALEEQSGSESDRTIKTDDYQSLSSYDDSDYNTDISSYHTAPEFEDGSSRPSFRRRPKKTVVGEGSSVKLECIVGGIPIPTVVWQKDNLPVVQSPCCSVITDGETSTLHLEKVDKSVAGQYSVKATNKNGTILCSAELLVLEDVGESAEFDREATPTPEDTSQDQVPEEFTKETTPVPKEIQEKSELEEPEQKSVEENKKEVSFEDKETKEEDSFKQKKENELVSAIEELEQEPEEVTESKETKEETLEPPENKATLEKSKLEPQEETKLAEEQEEDKLESAEKPKVEPEPKPKLDSKEEVKDTKEETEKLEDKNLRKDSKQDLEEPKEEATAKTEPEKLESAEESKKSKPKEEEKKPEPKEELKAEPEKLAPTQELITESVEEPKKSEPKEEPKAEPKKLEPTEELITELVEEPKKLKPKEEEKKPEPKEEPKAEPEKLELTEELITEPVEDPKKSKPKEEEKKPELKEKPKAEPEKLEPTEEPITEPVEEPKKSKSKEEEKKPEPKEEPKAEPEKLEPVEEPKKSKSKEEEKKPEPKEESRAEPEKLEPTEELITEPVEEPKKSKPKEEPKPKLEPEEPKDEVDFKEETVEVKAEEDLAYIPEEKPKNQAPVFVENMKDCDIEEGRLARFDCRVCAFPVPEITWEKDGKVVEEDSHFKLLHEKDEIFSLLIKDCTISDGGRYRCWARNEYGEAYTESVLNVIALDNLLEEGEVKPAFTTRFYDVEVTEGVPAEFVCMVKGQPSPDVKWYLNGELLKPAEDILIRKEEDGHQLLAFRNVRLDQAGEITCKLKNELGEATCTGQLIVKEDPRRHGPEVKPPKFIKKPIDCEVNLGEDIKIECTVAGEPEPEVTWYFEDRELFESHRRILRKHGNNHVLKLRNLATMNAGEYTIRAVNMAGEASCTFKLNVNEVEEVPDRPSPKRTVVPETKYGSAPSFASRIQDARVTKGGKARFECRTMGIPQPEIQWFKDGRPVSPNDHVKIGRDATGFYLTVTDVAPEDEGEYSCNIKNDSGKASCAARLQIGEPLPSTAYQYQPRQKKHYTPSFSTLDYAPPFKRTFVELAPDEKVPTLPIGKPTLFEVKADGAKLSWLPAYTSGLPENAGPCSYTVEAREMPGAHWSKLSTDIYGTTYLARQLRPDREYQFRVRAENRFGSSEPSSAATLAKREAEKPKHRYTETPEIKEMLARFKDAPPVLPTSTPLITDMGQENVRLAWKPVELPTKHYHLPDVTYSIEAQKLPSERWEPLASKVSDTSYYLSDFDTDRDYNIRIRAENQYGRSAPTQSLWLPRATAFPGVPVSRPNIIDLEPETVRLSWSKVRVPAFENDEEPLLYMIEMQEPPSLDWNTIARRLPDTSYKVTGLSPGHDYRFRVRPVTVGGTTLDPSPAASLFRTLAQSHVPVDRVRIDDYDPDYESARLSWRRVDIPPFDNEDEPLLYMIEQSDRNVDNWHPVVSGLPVTSYRIPDISPADDYRFRVRAITPYGLSPPSHDAGLYRGASPMRPLASDSLKILDMEPDRLRLAWQPTDYKSTEPIRYQIESQQLPSLEWRPLAKDITDTNYLLSGIQPTTDYRLRVRPHTTSGYLEPTEPVSLTNLPVRPRLPIREPSISDIGATSVELAWKPAEIPMYSRQIIPVTYAIDMLEHPGTNWIPVSRRIPESHYLVTGLRPDTDYDFRVRPETEYGPGEVSLPVKLRRRPVLTLPPREPILSYISPDSCELSWNPVKTLSTSQPVTYRVEIKEPPSTQWKHLIGKVTGTNLPIRFLRPDQDYLFRVVAESGKAESEPTQAAYLPHRGGPPRMPTESPYISDVYPDSLMLSWRSVELPSRITTYAPIRYNIEVKESPLFEWRPLVHGVPRTQYHITGLKPDRDYVFRVRAESNFGLSEPTEPITVYRRPVLPALPTEEPMLSDVKPSSARLSWRRASIPSYMHDTTIPVTYTIFCQEYPDTNWRPLVRRIPYTDYTVMGLDPDKDYSFRVQAENDFGTSKPTFPTTLYRRPEYQPPIAYPEIENYQPSYLQLKWRRPSLPSLPPTKPITYSLESYEPVDRKWIPYASKIPDTSFRVSELTPSRDYMFRVRPEIGTEILEPSLPISYSKRRVLPSVPVERPEIFELEPESVSLSWRPVRLPSYDAGDLPRRFRVEMRELTNPHWTSVAPSMTGLNYKIRDLNPDVDYAFRVRSLSDDGVSSDPSPSVFLHRRPVISRPPVHLPTITSVDDTSLALGWQRVDIPAFEYDQEPMTFIIEGQRLPDYNWQPVARGLKDMSYKVRDLDPHGDYHFRIRGESSSGLSEPSPVIPFYRKPVRSGVPIARPTILNEDATTARLRWSPAYIPNYSSNIPKSYVIEKQESPSPIWRPLAKGVTSTDYTVTDLSPRKDYHFRIRSVSPFGKMSEPTPPIPFYRTQLLKYEPLPIYQMKLIHEDYSSPNRPYIESLTTKVPPRLSIEKPELHEITPETITLAWNQARVPATTAMMSPTTYRIEVRQPNSFDWREVISGIVGQTHMVKDLNPLWDYAFRVRAVNDYGLSEPTLPVFLNRRSDTGHHIEDYDYETQFGESVPPKLPIDSPAMLDMMPESLTLKWFPARIPAYAKKAPITYAIEMKEPMGTGWRRTVSGIREPTYHVSGLTPKQDYYFRIRAESPFGTSEPTLPASFSRSKAPVIKRSYDFDKDRELTSPARFLDSVTSGVPPRVPAGRPNMTKQAEDRLLLSWQTARMPSYLRDTPITYIVEMREPPSHAWSTLIEDSPETHYEVSKLRPDQDYMFRVRAKNEFGMSEPTLPTTLFRERDDRKPSQSRSGSRSRESASPFTRIRIGTPTSRERSETMERKIDYIPTAPDFLTPPDEEQFAVEGMPCKLFADVKGYPLPEITWYFKGKKLESGERFNSTISPIGQIDVEFDNTTWDDIGEYKCVAENEHGSSERIIPLKMADPPTFIEPLKDLVLLNRGTGKLECRVDGIPFPNIKFNKDWRPLTETSRVRIRHESPDYFSLTIDGALSMDAGQYTCVAENPAGKIFCSARIEVEENLPALCDLSFKNANIEDNYYIMEELGRGRHGVVRRVIEKSTGQPFAAKFITTREDGEKDFFRNELENIRLLNHKGVPALHDAYETPKNLVIVSELLTGGRLVDRAIVDNNWTEADAAICIKQLLDTLAHLHARNILHLDVKPSNILFPTSDSKDIKLIDFGLSRKIPVTGELRFNYGTPDYTSPEAINNERITPASDLWSVGVLAYTLLSGVTPFQAESEPETLEKVMDGEVKFVPVFENVSKEAKDFISKLLTLEPSNRPSLDECVNHPWIKNAVPGGKGVRLDTNNLKYFRDRDGKQKISTAVKTVNNLRSLRRMMDGDYSDLGFKPTVDPVTGQVTFPDSEAYGEFADEETWYDWQARTQQEAQLRTTQDTDYNLRVRGYRREEEYGPPSGMELEEAATAILDENKIQTNKERRLLSVDREDLPLTIEREMEWIDGIRKHRSQHEPVESSCPSKRSSISSVTGESELPPPLFKLKIQDKAFTIGEDILFKCEVVGPPPPTVTWYRNEELLTDGARIHTELLENGTGTLLIMNARPYDGGVYKCVARNKYGRTSCRARLQTGDVPNRPGRPVVTQLTSNSALLIWEAPKADGNSDILYYKVDCKKLGDERWSTVVKILHECAVIEGLTPDTSYRFRVSCINQFGMSPYSWSSVQVMTKASGGTILLDLDQEMALFKSHQADDQLTPVTSRRQTREEDDLQDDEEGPVLRKAAPDSDYNFTSSVWKGKFSEVKQCTKSGTNTERAVKIIPVSSKVDPETIGEYRNLRGIRHTKIARLYDAYFSSGQLYLILERLYGDHIVRQLAFKRRYSEDNVATVIRQVLGGLQYLHRIGIAHLNLEPGSIVTVSRRHLDVKIVDFGLSQKIPNQDGIKVPRVGYPDFISPEVVAQEKVTEMADIWGVAALTFLMLSGDSPYCGETDENTLLNIVYNRYDPHDLYDNISKEALKFIFKIMKRLPRNRLSIQDCLEHKWLLLTDTMVKTRQDAVFVTNKLRKFCKDYDENRRNPAYRRDFTTFNLPETKPVKRVKPKSKVSKTEPTNDEAVSSEPEPVSDAPVSSEPEPVSDAPVSSEPGPVSDAPVSSEPEPEPVSDAPVSESEQQKPGTDISITQPESVSEEVEQKVEDTEDAAQ